jgi:hypothetical protein
MALRLAFDQGLFRIGSQVDRVFFGSRIAPQKPPPSQSQIVRYPENPTRQILPGFALLQMPQKRKKYFLDDLFAIRTGDSKAQEVLEQRAPIPIEKSNYIVV